MHKSKKRNSIKTVNRETSNKFLNELVNCLINDNLNINTELVSDDGRVNSSLSEGIVLNYLASSENVKALLDAFKLKLLIPTSREWYDFLVYNESFSVYTPVNVKISAMKTADNVSSKKGVNYALTGIRPKSKDIKEESDGLVSDDWNEFNKTIENFIDKNEDSDYYFLVINKNDTRDVFVTSLKTLENIRPNGNNLPFMCNWNKNRKRISRSNSESCLFILDCLLKSNEQQLNNAKNTNKSIKKAIRRVRYRARRK